MIKKQSVSELKDIHNDRPIAILGSGKSLPEDVKAISHLNPIWFGVNIYSRNCIKDPDYLYSGGGCNEENWKTTDQNKTIRFSFVDNHSDYLLHHNKDIWNSGNGAGAIAMSIACFMGGNPVLLCGMDCFRSGWFDNPDRARTMEMDMELQTILKLWARALDVVPNIANVRVVGDSPLREVFKSL